MTKTRITSKQTAAERRAQSLDQVEPLSPAAQARRSPTAEVAKARQKPLNRLSADALLALLHDGRSLKHILPIAVQAALPAPWADHGFHRGDLLLAVLHTPTTVHPQGTRLHGSLVSLAKAAMKAAEKLPKARRQPDIEAEVARWLQQWERSPNE